MYLIYVGSEINPTSDLTLGKAYWIDPDPSVTSFLDDAGDSREVCLHTFKDLDELYEVSPEEDKLETSEVKSDGGSSSYYEITLPQHIIDSIVATGKIEVKDIVKYGFDNDFDAGNIVKATKRIISARSGTGKAGTGTDYDVNKIKFFAEELKTC